MADHNALDYDQENSAKKQVDDTAGAVFDLISTHQSYEVIVRNADVHIRQGGSGLLASTVVDYTAAPSTADPVWEANSTRIFKKREGSLKLAMICNDATGPATVIVQPVQDAVAN